MQRFLKILRDNFLILLGILTLVSISILVLYSIAPSLFPIYFVYLILALIAFIILSQIDFEVISLFGNHFYVLSLIILMVTLLIGRVTRGTIRWIPLGPLSIQPAEIVRPFLFIFFANYLSSQNLKLGKFLKAIILLGIPVFLIFIQPSLGVSLLTIAGFIGILLASTINKKYFLFATLGLLALAPLFWLILAPYQKTRILTFLEPWQDPKGAGYNAIESMISVGSGGWWGKGLGKGTGTQLSFLPERQTDFIYAATAEELGFVGVGLILVAEGIILLGLIRIMENSRSPQARAFVAGFFLTFFLQTFIHIGMNIGILPITGVPLPLVSAGGSSLLATFMGLAIALGAKKEIT